LDLSVINPWWRIPERTDDDRDIKYVRQNIVEKDRELSRYAHSRVRIKPKEIELLARRTVNFRGEKISVISLPIVITVRGPRQIGKTTFLKLLILRLIGYRIHPLKGGYVIKRATRIAKNLNVIYVDCDKLGLEEHRELIETVVNTIDEHSKITEGKFYVFVDEVTNIKNWSRAAKGLSEILINKATLVLTGSHSLDVKIVSETLAGRRGEERLFRTAIPTEPDIEYLPVRFREYVANIDPDIRELLWELELMKITKRLSILIDIVSMENEEIPDELREIRIKYDNKLRRYLDNYLITGGIPRVINEYYTYGTIDPSTYETYVRLVLKDAHRLGLSERILLDIMHEITETIATPIGIAKISQKIGVGRDTVFKHIEFLEHAFMLMYIYPYDPVKGKKYITGMPRKYYILDPFIIHAFRAKTLGLTSPFETSKGYLAIPNMKGRLYENIVAVHLRHLTRETAGTPLYMYNEFIYYGKVDGGEVDFLIHLSPYRKSMRKIIADKLGSPEGTTYIPIEVTSEEKLDRRYLSGLVKAASSTKVKGIAITSKNMETHRTFTEIPIHIFLLLI